jgi:hypothetical protein
VTIKFASDVSTKVDGAAAVDISNPSGLRAFGEKVDVLAAYLCSVARPIISIGLAVVGLIPKNRSHG